LQIDTYLLRIITITADDLSRGTSIDDLERPWTRTIGVFSDFFHDWWLPHISRVNCVEITGHRPRRPANEIFSIKVDFNSASFDRLGSRSPPYERIKFGYVKTCDFCYFHLACPFVYSISISLTLCSGAELSAMPPHLSGTHYHSTWRTILTLPF